jgi:hypothetical protein
MMLLTFMAFSAGMFSTFDADDTSINNDLEEVNMNLEEVNNDLDLDVVKSIEADHARLHAPDAPAKPSNGAGNRGDPQVFGMIDKKEAPLGIKDACHSLGLHDRFCVPEIAALILITQYPPTCDATTSAMLSACPAQQCATRDKRDWGMFAGGGFGSDFFDVFPKYFMRAALVDKVTLDPMMPKPCLERVRFVTMSIVWGYLCSGDRSAAVERCTTTQRKAVPA